MNEGIKSLIDLAATLVEVLAPNAVSIEPAEPLIKLGLCGIAFTSMAWRIVANRKKMKEDGNVGN